MALLDEINEQPRSLERVIDRNGDVVGEVARTWRREEIDHVVIAARGTSDNAARYAKYVLGLRNRLPVGLAAPSMFSLYDSPPNLGRSAVVGISQSGESPDIVSVLAEAKRQGRPTLAITNEPSSPLATLAQQIILLHSGREESIAATKTYTAELMAIALLSTAILGDLESNEATSAMPSHVEFMLEQSGEISQMARRHTPFDRCTVLGRGYNHSSAFEWALKLQELAYVLAHPLSTADFRHGPVALVEPGFPVMAIAASGPIHADIQALLVQLASKRAELVVISDADEILALTETAIRLPSDGSEWTSPIPAIVGAQLFTYHLTVAKGLDPESPRGLNKVTRTL